MRYLNLGILAHVDAGKTSLTERLLHAAGVIDEIGSVDRGTTRTDSMELERRRGITIKAAVTAFPLGTTSVNLVDTPGHPDFIAEVERSLGVLDGVVLVVSAVEGVQAQTRVLMRAVRRLGLPTVLFVNKVDRGGADPERVLVEISSKLTSAAFPLGGIVGAGTREARFVSDVPELRRLGLWSQLAADSRRGMAHPVYFGSAITGAGIRELMVGIEQLLPRSADDDSAKAAGRIFKVERGIAGERIAYVRMFAGALKTRDRLPSGRVTGISVLSAADGAPVPADRISAGQIGVVRGLTRVRIGDRLGAHAATGEAEAAYFAPPTLETVVEPREQADRGPMFAALTQLSEQDPLIGLRYDKARAETSLSLYGEVQKEVIQSTLAEEYGVAVDFRETTPICVERVLGIGEGLDVIKGGDNPFLATVGLQDRPGTGRRGGVLRAGDRARIADPGVPHRDRGDRPRDARLGAARLADPGRDGDSDPQRLLGPAEPCARHLRQKHVEHGRRLPGADPAGAHGGVGEGRDRGLRTDAPVPAGSAERFAGSDPAGPRDLPRRTRIHHGDR